ncbi:MAG: ribonuclease P protein component [Ignavibacteria bacterium]
MDSSENQSKSKGIGNGDFKLGKHEIISGHNAYINILQNSVTVSTNNIKAFVSIKNKASLPVDSTESPLFTNNVKVGFIIAKKKIKKAVSRNRIRRLFKEAYRLNKNKFTYFPPDTNIIFSLTDGGYEHFGKNKNEKFEFINIDMKILSDKIIKRIK